MEGPTWHQDPTEPPPRDSDMDGSMAHGEVHYALGDLVPHLTSVRLDNSLNHKESSELPIS